MQSRWLVVAALALVALASLASATTYFVEEFKDGWQDRWVQSSAKRDGTVAPFVWTAGKWYGDKDAKGIQTQQDMRFYQTSAKMPVAPFTNEGKDFVLQFAVKFEQTPECGGAYVKVLPASLDQTQFDGNSEYNIMFGPDVCGTATRKIHTIFNYKGQNLLWKKTPKCETDQLTHVYTLVVRPDNTYEVLVDMETRESGRLEEDWDFLPPRQISDPDAKKPADWVDDEYIDDPEDKKPAGWDDIPERILDVDAKKPEEWDDDDDGEWTPPTIPNPEYKGQWKPRRIKNPAYKGPWVHPKIDNPEYKPDDKLYVQRDMQHVGFELWQVKSGSLFSNIIVTDSLDEAKALAERTWKAQKDAEKAMYDEIQEQERKKRDAEAEVERKKREEAEAATKSDASEEVVATTTTTASTTTTAADDESGDDDAADAKAKARRAKLDELKRKGKDIKDEL